MSRLRALPDPDHLPALDPSYAIARPALGSIDRADRGMAGKRAVTSPAVPPHP